MKRGDFLGALLFAAVMAAIFYIAWVLAEDCESRGGELRAYAGCIDKGALR